MGPVLIRRQVGVVPEHARTVESARADLRLADWSREPRQLHPPRSRLVPPSLSKRGPEGPQAALADDRHAKSDNVGWNARTGDSLDSRDTRVGRLRCRAGRRRSCATRPATTTPSRQQKAAEEDVSDTNHGHSLPALPSSHHDTRVRSRLSRLRRRGFAAPSARSTHPKTTSHHDATVPRTPGRWDAASAPASESDDGVRWACRGRPC